MSTKAARNKTEGAGRLSGPEPDGAPNRQEDSAALLLDASLALHMGLPGTRLDMVLGGAHPLLVQLVRAMAQPKRRA